LSIIIHTQAYNGEKTLRRSIESILQQTYSDFLYYISDNASTDETAAIISEYASKDKRIVPIFNKTNEFYAYHNVVKDCCRKHPDSYWTMLDADDEYLPEFLEKMLGFIQKNDLDLAACGFTAINEESKQELGSRQIPHNMIITGAGFCSLFNQYHMFMRNVCAKLFSLQLLSKCTFETVKRMPSYGGDTIFTTEAFSKAERVGIIKGSLHNVYYVPTSISSKWEPNRADSNYIRDDFTRAFLMDKCGEISAENEKFLHGVYAASVIETLPVLLNPKLELEFIERANYILGIVEHEKTQALLREYAYESSLDEKLRVPICNWLLSKDDSRHISGATLTAEIILLIYPRLSILADVDTLINLIIQTPEMVKQLLDEYRKQDL